eukprot:Nk52_evm26s485 gene=Nk52_evmTU26s485
MGGRASSNSNDIHSRGSIQRPSEAGFGGISSASSSNMSPSGGNSLKISSILPLPASCRVESCGSTFKRVWDKEAAAARARFRKKKSMYYENGNFENSSGEGGGRKKRQNGTAMKEEVSLFRVLTRCFGREYYILGVLKFIADILAFTGPVVMSPLITYLQMPAAESSGHGATLNRGGEGSIEKGDDDSGNNISITILLCACLVAGTLASALISSWVGYAINKVAIRIRTCLVDAIYKKALVVDESDERLQQYVVGEKRGKTSPRFFTNGDADKSSTAKGKSDICGTGGQGLNMLNLMSTDCERVTNFCNSFHMVWSLPFQIGISLYLLYFHLGITFLAGFVFALLLIPINKCIASRIVNLSKKMMYYKDKRVGLMEEILSGIKLVKFMPIWKRETSRHLKDYRNRELNFLKGRKYLDALCVYFWATTPVFISILTFAMYSYTGHQLTPAKVFSSLCLFNMLVTPLNALPWVINGLMEAWVSCNRIQMFLNAREVLPVRYDPSLDDNAVISIGPCSIRRGPSLDPEEKAALRKVRSSETHSIPPEADCEEEPLLSKRPPDGDFHGAESAFEISVPEPIRVPEGSLVTIEGKTGSGKTTLVHAILNEATVLDGDILLSDQVQDGGISYCANTPWIRNRTIRENILYGKPFQYGFYVKTLFACGLLPDISTLGPDFDLTIIGDNGATLSGGQKSRIALARAVYQQTPVYLLDDCFSALDAHVAKHIYRYVICGLLSGSTCILVTHNKEFTMKADIELSIESGKLQRKRRKSALGNSSSKDWDEENSFSDSLGTSGKRHRHSIEVENELLNLDHVYALYQNDVEVLKLLSYCKTFVRSSVDIVPQTETKEEGSVKFGVYMHYGAAIGWGLCFVVFVGLLLMQLSRNSSDLWLSYWVHNEPGTEVTTLLYLKIYAVLAIFNSVVTLFRAFSFAYAGVTAAYNVHERLFDAFINARMVFFDHTPFGRILNRFSSDLYAVDDELPFQANIFLAQLFSIGGAIFIVCLSLPMFILPVIPLAIIYMSLQNYYRKTSRELKRLDTVTKSPLYSNFREAVEGTSTIRAFGSQRQFIDNNCADLEANQRAVFNSQAAVQWFFLRLQLINVFVILSVCAIALFMRHVLHTLNVGLLGLSLSYALTISGTLSGLVNSFAETEKEMVSMERIQDYIDNVPREPFSSTEGGRDVEFVRKGNVYFNDVYVRYPGSPRYAIAGITFYIRKGQKIGIVGRTGSGKSTLFSALFRILEISMGSISIDKKNINSVDLHTLRSSISIIPQDPVMFTGTIRYNIDPSEKASDMVIWNLVDKCHLRDIVNSFKGGLYHMISNKNSGLSSGQKQLICMARAILLNSKIVCIDEATSSVDRGTEKFVQDTLKNEFHDVTVLTIAHRVETILNNDKILVLNEGTLVEYDSPVSLLKNRKSFFYGMVEASKASERKGKRQPQVVSQSSPSLPSEPMPPIHQEPVPTVSNMGSNASIGNTSAFQHIVSSPPQIVTGIEDSSRGGSDSNDVTSQQKTKG